MNSNHYHYSKKVEELTRHKAIDFEALGLTRKTDEDEESYRNRLLQNKKFVEFQRWSTDKKHFEELSKISSYDRLASFMNYQEEKQNKKEFNFLVQKTAIGAVMGGSFAAAGAFVAEQLGVANWLSEHNPFKAAGKGVEAAKDHFSSDDAVVASNEGTNIAETAATEEATSSTNSNSAESASSEVVSVVETKSAPVVETTNSEVVNEVVETKSAPVVETEKFVDEITNKGLNGKSDSVWRSTREIFKNNAADLGYKGDLNDAQAVNRWAETQTATAISNSGEISDKIFEGNKVVLIKDGDHFKTIVEQAEGAKPGQLNPEVEVSSNSADQIESVAAESEPVVNNLEKFAATPDSTTTNSTNLFDEPETPVTESFHFNPEAVQSEEPSFVYDKDGGKAHYDYRNGNMEMVFTDKNGASVPKSFIDEARGKTSMDKFMNKGLDKAFKNWHNLNNNDRSLYELLDSKMPKNELLNQIKTQFKIDSDNIKIAPDNKFIVQTGLNKQESFDLNFKGVKKMIKLLAKI